eukprot:gene4944-3536_t
MSIQISDILLDPTLTSADKASLTKFRALVETFLEEQNPPGSEWKNLSMFQLCESVGVDLSSLAKEGQMLSALWVIVLRGIRKYTPDENLKYPTFESFKTAYGDEFSRDDEAEWKKLWQVANWMHILFELIPAKKNKGLSMLVAPRFVEGWHVKYVTGSGQTHYTANRVRVFETEGETKAAHRGKLKMKPKTKKGGNGTPHRSSSDDDEASVGYTMQSRELSMTAADYSHPRKKKVTHVKRELSADSASTDTSDVRRSKRAKADFARMPPPPIIPGRCTTDVLRQASNDECREAYQEFQSTGVQRDETALLIPDLMRSDSWVNPGATAGSAVPGPLAAERNITWGEIPVAPTLQSSSNPYGLSSLSNVGTFSLGSVFMGGNPPPMGGPMGMRPEGSENPSVFGGSPPPTAGGVFSADKLSEVFGGFMPSGFQMSMH